MSLIRKNIAANFVGSIWQAAISLAFVPLYIKILGIESWGLIGFFITIQALFGLLDMGLSSTINREMARLSILPGRVQEMHDLLRTLEIVYWFIAAFVGISVVALAPYVAHHWIKAGKLPPETIEQACLIMGFVIALQMPVGFYSGGLRGLQRQVLLNLINVSASTFRAVGAVLVLWQISPTVQAFFVWQVLSSFVNIGLLVFFLWRNLPHSGTIPTFQWKLFKGIWRFTVGMTGIAILGTILTQMDKIILSRILSLEMFGYYMLASMVAMSLGRIFTPIFYSIYPRFTQLVAVDDLDGLIRLYHKSCQFISVLIFPVAITVAVFSYEVMLLWTDNAITASKTHLLVSVLICGSVFNGIMNPPYALQLAYGWTRLSVLKNLVAVSLLVPSIIYAARHYGPMGAASVWLVLNVGYVLIEIPIMHLRLLRGEKWRWYLYDVGVPLLVGVTCAGFGRYYFLEPMLRSTMQICVPVILTLTYGVTAIMTPVTRAWLSESFLSLKFISERKSMAKL